jgi:hypothetical protein
MEKAADDSMGHGDAEGKTVVNAVLTGKREWMTRVQRRCCESRGWESR